MFEYPKKYDVLIIGGGHAGVEAAMAAARVGAQVLAVPTPAMQLVRRGARVVLFALPTA